MSDKKVTDEQRAAIYDMTQKVTNMVYPPDLIGLEVLFRKLIADQDLYCALAMCALRGTFRVKYCLISWEPLLKHAEYLTEKQGENKYSLLTGLIKK